MILMWFDDIKLEVSSFSVLLLTRVIKYVCDDQIAFLHAQLTKYLPEEKLF
jgi:hypothetical protein